MEQILIWRIYLENGNFIFATVITLIFSANHKYAYKPKFLAMSAVESDIPMTHEHHINVYEIAWAHSYLPFLIWFWIPEKNTLVCCVSLSCVWKRKSWPRNFSVYVWCGCGHLIKAAMIQKGRFIPVGVGYGGWLWSW